MLPRHAYSRLVAGVLLMSLTLMAGCSFRGGDTPRIGMETDETDILFGRPEAQEAAEQEAAAAAAAAEALLEEEEFRGFLRPINFATSGPKPNCPEAPPLSAISEESGTEVKETPQEGTHRWIAGGSYGVPGVPNSKIPISDSPNHYIKPSRPVSDPVAPPPGSPQSLNFTYQTIEPRVGPGLTGLWQFQWKVKSNSSVAQDPEGGLALTRIDVLDQDGRGANRYFAALEGTGLLLIPFPVRPGGTWNSASAEPGGRSFRLSGQVLSREVIDACGTLVQGWHVRSTFSEGTNQATLDYLIATQLGGQIISMNIDGFFLGTTFNPANFRLGQVDPDPLPSRFR